MVLDELNNIKVLAFDVFGTVVDWHGSLVNEIERLKLDVDSSEFALAWRAGYALAMQKVRSGELEWTLLDDLHRMILEEIPHQFGVTTLDESQKQHLNKAWHRLEAWPDSVEGLQRLKSQYIICTLSNGNIGLLANMAKAAGLPWDCILSAELFRTYKPDPDTYLGVVKVFDLAPEQVMLVAAHQNDLAAAHNCDLKTAYIERPMEFGSTQLKDVSPNPENTLHAINIVDLATLFEC